MADQQYPLRLTLSFYGPDHGWTRWEAHISESQARSLEQAVVAVNRAAQEEGWLDGKQGYTERSGLSVTTLRKREAERFFKARGIPSGRLARTRKEGR